MTSFRHVDWCFYISFVVLAQLVRCQWSLLSWSQHWLEVMTSMNWCLCRPMPRSLRLGLSFIHGSFAHQDVLLPRYLLIYVIVELLSNLLFHLLVCLHYWLSAIEEWLSCSKCFWYWSSRKYPFILGQSFDHGTFTSLLPCWSINPSTTIHNREALCTSWILILLIDGRSWLSM